MKQTPLYKALSTVRNVCCQIGYFLKEGVRQKQGLARFKICLKLIHQQLEHFGEALSSHQEFSLEEKRIQKLVEQTKDLHTLLPRHALFTYSILVPVYKPNPLFLKTALKAALDQSASEIEVLVGFDGVQPQEVYQTVKELQEHYGEKLKSFQIDREKSGGGISATTNAIAKYAKGNFLLLMDHDDWIRPDLLYRYEQVLRSMQDPLNTVLYCNEYKIDEHDQFVLNSKLYKPEQPPFPYLFVNFICHCLLIPKRLWEQVEGCRSECDLAQDYDLALRLDLAGAYFRNVPLFLYAWRVHSQSTAKNVNQKPQAKEAGIRALKDYAHKKKLNWIIDHGYLPTTYQAIPNLEHQPQIHVVILIKDELKNSIEAIKSTLNQRNVMACITVVFRNEDTLSPVQKQLKQLGCELLYSEEPYHYSRWNNFAIKHSLIGQKCESLLFLNPEIHLENHAFFEMSRWINQPSIGMVSCRLHDLSGRLQHGGIDFREDLSATVPWQYTDGNKIFDTMGFSKVLRIPDALTGDCILMKKLTFHASNGFDPSWHSEAAVIDFALKLKNQGLHCLYTPYVAGSFHGSSTMAQTKKDYTTCKWVKQIDATINLNRI